MTIGDLRGYVPLRLMGDPPPRSAREVMKLGDAVTLVVTSFAPARRSIDLAIPKVAPIGERRAEPAARGDRRGGRRRHGRAQADGEEGGAAAPVASSTVAAADAALARAETPAPAPVAAKRGHGEQAGAPVVAAPAPAEEPAVVAEPAPADGPKAPATKARRQQAPAKRPPPSRRRRRRRPPRRRRRSRRRAKKAAAASTGQKARGQEGAGQEGGARRRRRPSGAAAKAAAKPAPAKRTRAAGRTAPAATALMRFATWNINSLNVRQERVEQWLADVQPDVVCLQETKLADDAFPQLAFEAMGYSAAHHGEGRWNGVAILSRVGLDDVSFGFADGAEPDAEARLMTARCDGITVVTVYVPNGRGARRRPLPVQAGVARPARTPTSSRAADGRLR